MICSVFNKSCSVMTTGLMIFILVLTTLTYLTDCKPTTSNDFVNTTTTLWTTEAVNTTHRPSTTIDTLSDFPEWVIDYLVRYGYMDEKRAYKINKTPFNAADKLSYKRSELEAGLREYQDFMTLPTTGRLDKRTMEALHKKRCGMPDKVRRDDTTFKMSLTPTGQRKKRDLVLQKVDKNKKGSGFASSKTTRRFYWNINPKPKYGGLLRPNIWLSLEYAFNRWASVTDAVFIRGDRLNWSDILIGFWTKDHGDGNPFDGPGGTVGHADVSNRNVHLDEEENWGAKPEDIFLWLHPSKGTDFIQAAIHEIGHVLGLSHDKDSDSVMFPTLQQFQPLSYYSLSTSDMNRIKSSFGRCEPDMIDAIFVNKFLDGKTYIIKGPFIYQMDERKREVVQSWPRATTLPFLAPTFVDEAFWHTDHFLYFFNKDGYYIYDSTNDPTVNRSPLFNLNKNGYDVGFRGLKHHKYIDAAMVMDYKDDITGKTKPTSFLFQDEWVYKWDKVETNWQRSIIPAEKVADGWPKLIRNVFPGLPGRIDTAFTWSYDGRTYFFVGRYFYIWDPVKNIADGLYPTYQWQNVCEIYLCQVAPTPNVYNCESWDLTMDNCHGYCHN